MGRSSVDRNQGQAFITAIITATPFRQGAARRRGSALLALLVASGGVMVDVTSAAANAGDGSATAQNPVIPAGLQSLASATATARQEDPTGGGAPALLPRSTAEAYRTIFADIDAGRWEEASARLDAMGHGPLHAYARAELYTAKGSPKVDGETLAALALADPTLPQAPQLVTMAHNRDAKAVPLLPEARRMIWLGSAPRRGRLGSVDSSAGTRVAARLQPLIKEDRPAEAETLLAAETGMLDEGALTEWRQRIAWSYFITGDTGNARRLATQASAGNGDWAAQADWVVGLSAWRQKDWLAASDAFAAVARRATNPEMVAAGHYWAARADLAGNRAARVQPHLRSAARLDETFYGMLAQAKLGLSTNRTAGERDSTSRQLMKLPNVVTAIGLAEIGQNQRADTVLRWQARIGLPTEHDALTRLAGTLGLPSTQMYLAHNGPSGARMTRAARYPMPAKWTPKGGYRVDQALLFAHALEESRFRVDVTSPAGARGLMQVLPGTAREIAFQRGEASIGALNNPADNLEYGQSYIEHLRDRDETGGLLPKVIAAYNCGPTPVGRWNVRNAESSNDPLLYIESISYWETRSYVTTVLRNYWIYQEQAGRPTYSRTSLAENQWPRFPNAASNRR